MKNERNGRDTSWFLIPFVKWQNIKQIVLLVTVSRGGEALYSKIL